MSEIEKSFTTERYIVQYPVRPEHDGMRLDAFLKERWETLSREYLKKKIEKAEVVISGRQAPHRPSTKVHDGETVTVYTYKSAFEDEYWRGEKLNLILNPEVVFEDEDMILISKPPFMSTHPAGRHLFNCATVVFETKYNKTIHSAHRLDRETSGLLVLAKNTKTAGDIQQKFEHHQVRKCYFLVAHNTQKLEASNFPILAEERLAKGDELPNVEDLVTRLSIHCFDKNSGIGKHAETEFKFIWGNSKYLILLAYPKTGRQHQIRAHAAHHGFSLLGDKIYNGDHGVFTRFKDHLETEQDYQKMQIPRHALHSISLNFEYKGKKQIYIDHIPLDLKNWITQNIKEIKIDELEQQIKSKIKADFSDN
jgi:23S rRNA pseudouridine1911/1915/1917 synthase